MAVSDNSSTIREHGDLFDNELGASQQRLEDYRSELLLTNVDRAEGGYSTSGVELLQSFDRTGAFFGEQDDTQLALILGIQEEMLAISSIESKQEEISDRRDIGSLEQQLLDATRSGDAAAILKADQDLLALTQLDKAVSDQATALEAANRALFREAEAANALGEKLDRAEGSLARDRDSLARDILLTQRQAGIASRSGQQSAAQARNAAAQSGFGSSSAIRGAIGGITSRAATQSGDIMTGVVAIGKKQASNRDLLSDVNADRARQQGVLADIDFDKGALDARFNTNVDFLLDTFDLGGDIQATIAGINATNAAEAARQAQRGATIQGIVQGAGLAAALGAGGGLIAGAAILGGVIGGDLDLGEELSNLFNF